MKILCPLKTLAWGDNIINLWVSEYIKQKLPTAEIEVNDVGRDWCSIDKKFIDISHSDYININWADSIVKNNSAFNCEYILATHHRHDLGYDEFVNFKKIYFDAHGIYLKFVKENWYPTFIPTNKVLDVFKSLNLPEEYNVIHHAGFGSRNPFSVEHWLNNYNKLFEGNNIVSTGEYFENTIDCTHLSGWVKLYIMINAKNLYVSQSGFTSIASIYRKRKNTFLIGINRDVCHNMAPPIQSYGNVEFDYDLKKAYFFMEKMKIIDYYKFCKSLQSCNHKHADMEVFPKFEGGDYPLDFKPKEIYFEQENAPVSDLRTTIYEIK